MIQSARFHLKTFRRFAVRLDEFGAQIEIPVELRDHSVGLFGKVHIFRDAGEFFRFRRGNAEPLAVLIFFVIGISPFQHEFHEIIGIGVVIHEGMVLVCTRHVQENVFPFANRHFARPVAADLE